VKLHLQMTIESSRRAGKCGLTGDPGEAQSQDSWRKLGHEDAVLSEPNNCRHAPTGRDDWLLLMPRVTSSMGSEINRLRRHMVEELRRSLASEPLRWRITRKHAATGDTGMKRKLAVTILVGYATSSLIAAVRVLETTGPRGTIGLGTWRTQAAYRDIEVTAGDSVLYRSDFTTEAKDWKPSGGDWRVSNGSYLQSAKDENLRSVLSLPELAEATDYTVRLRAYKLSGSEGFLIMFHVTDNGFYWLNLGGWNNTGHEVEHNRVAVGGRVPGRIETGRWYDIRIELAGPRIKCFLNDAQILDVND
jgi:hypothetical protein